LYPRVFVIPCCSHITQSTERCQLQSTLPGLSSEHKQTFNMQLLTVDVRQLVACLVWRPVGCRGRKLLRCGPVVCFSVGEIRRFGKSVLWQSQTTEWRQQRRWQHRSDTHTGCSSAWKVNGTSLSASRYGPCTYRTHCGWLSGCDWIILQGTPLSQWLAGPASLLHSGYQQRLRESSGRNVNLAIKFMYW